MCEELLSQRISDTPRHSDSATSLQSEPNCSSVSGTLHGHNPDSYVMTVNEVSLMLLWFLHSVMELLLDICCR